MIFTLGIEAYTEPCQTFEIKLFDKIATSQVFANFPKSFMVDVFESSEYAPGVIGVQRICVVPFFRAVFIKS